MKGRTLHPYTPGRPEWDQLPWDTAREAAARLFPGWERSTERGPDADVGFIGADATSFWFQVYGRGEFAIAKYTGGPTEAELRDRLGFIALRINPLTSSLNALYAAEPAGLDPDGGPYVTICEAHGQLVNHTSKATAKRFLPHADNWCTDCQRTETEAAG